MQPTHHSSGFRILVVDDEKVVLDLMADILREAGFAVDAFESPVDALEQVEKTGFDALVLDVYMPEMPGMLFHAKLKMLDGELAQRTVFTSGHFSRDELRRHVEERAVFLQKPFQPDELVETVSGVLPAAPRSVAA